MRIFTWIMAILWCAIIISATGYAIYSAVVPVEKSRIVVIEGPELTRLMKEALK